MDILDPCRQRAEKDPEQDQAHTRHDYDGGNSRAKRIDQDNNRQDQQKNSASCKDAAPGHTEGIEVAGKAEKHEAVVKHPESEHYRKKSKGYTWINAEEQTEKKVKNTSDYDIAPHHEIIPAGRGCNQLGRTHDKHNYSSQYADGHITFERESKNSYAGCYAKHSRNKHKPPVLYGTGGFTSKIFKSTFHDTDNLTSSMKDNYCAKDMLLITIGFPPNDQNPAM